MIDYGVKAPTEAIILDNLVAAKLAVAESITAEELVELMRSGTTGLIVIPTEDGATVGRPADRYISMVYHGRIPKVAAVYAEDGETVIAPATFTADVHVDIRFDGPDAQKMAERLKARTLVALKDDPVDGAPVTEGRADGFKIFPRVDAEGRETIKTPHHRFA